MIPNEKRHRPICFSKLFQPPMADINSRILRTIYSTRKSLTDSYRLLSSALLTVLLRTHVKRWERVAREGRPPWDERNELIARLIPEHSSVLDIGCGAQTLRKHLGSGCKYQPCDIVQGSSDIIYCDFNSGIYPAVDKLYDYVVCSGVFEYIRKPKEFLAKVSLLGRTMLMSYNPLSAGDSKLGRLGNNWINHFTKSELEELFAEIGLTWASVASEKLPYLLYSIQSNAKEGKISR